MKQTFQKICVVTLQIYFLVAFVIVTPYFNWRYAVQNGFVSWFYFGEVVATAQAMIWPYYAVASFSSGQSSALARNELHLNNSKRACDEAMRIVIRFNGFKAMPPKESSEVVKLFQASVTEAELVDDSFLQQLHPEFCRRYREDYIGSLRTLAEGLRTGDHVKLISAAATYNSYTEWMRTHVNEFKSP